MAEVRASSLPTLPKEASALELSLRHSVIGWKTKLKSLMRSTSKAEAMTAGAPESPGLLSPPHSEVSSGAVTPETLSKKVSRL